MTRFLLDAAPLVAVFLAALIANHRVLGPSPIVWVDTFNDEDEVRECLDHDSCTLSGMSTAIAGQAGAIAWIELRTLLAWAGLAMEDVHRLIQFLNALAVVLVFHLATLLGTPLAGGAAAWIFMDRIEALVRVTALHNGSFVLFLGAVFVVSCTAVVVRPGIVSVVLAALVAAVMANVHAACIVTGASVVWVALTASRRRFALALLGGAVFAVATFSVAPPTWLRNLTGLLEHGVAAAPSIDAVAGPQSTMLFWSFFAVAAWVASLASRSPDWVRCRRLAQGALGILVPLLAAYLVGARFGMRPESKYLFHAKAACAVAAALPMAALADAMLRRVLASGAARAAQWSVGVALALAVALPRGFAAEDERAPTLADLAAVDRILGVDRGWGRDQMLARLKTPYGVELLAGLRHVSVAGEGTGKAGRGAVLLVLEAEDVPEPLPSNWTVVRRAPSSTVVLIDAPSRIDWSRFVACAEPAGGSSAEVCEETGWRSDASPFVARLPPTGWRGTLRLKLSLGTASPGSAEQIYMPRAYSVCGGRIVSPASAGLQVDADGRRATIEASESDASNRPIIEIEWEVGSPECDAQTYDGSPPFFVEGDPETVRRLEAILRRRER